MTPLEYARAELLRLRVSDQTLAVFDQLTCAFADRPTPAASLVLSQFSIARISPMTTEQALARLTRPAEAEAVGILKNALAELADLKALDGFLDTWGERARYAVRRNPKPAAPYSVIFYTGRFPSFRLPPNAHGPSPVVARRLAVKELKK